MKIRNKKKMITLLLIFTLITLSICDFYIIRIRNDKKYSSNTNILEKKTNEKYKNYNYSDIINNLDKCSPDFVLTKIEKNNTNKNFINTDIKYKGEIEGLIKALNTLKMQEITKDISEINIEKTENREYIVEINVNFFKYK